MSTVEYKMEALYDSVREHLRARYEGVFPVEQIDRHFLDYVQLELSQGQLLQIKQVIGLRPGMRLLDLGCGFGSFVFVCRQNGIEAIGLDVTNFDLDFARKRLVHTFPRLDADSVYLKEDAQAIRQADKSFDVVTAWNLLEHVPDYRLVVSEAYRLLKPGGVFFGIAPNYAAFRREAHYLVPWLPLLPHPIASLYLRLLGRCPDFFEQQVHYVTNRGILKALQKQGFQLVYPDLLKLDQPERIISKHIRNLTKLLGRLHLLALFKQLILLHYWGFFKTSTSFVARKPA